MKIKWLDTFKVEIIDQFDEENDNIDESHIELMKAGETDEVDITNEDGDYVDIQFGNGSIITCLLRKTFVEITGDEEEPKTFKKITEGCVIQTYKILSNGTQVCTAQEFQAGDAVDYESDGEGCTFVVNPINEVYCPFEMVQPKNIPSGNPVKDSYPDGICPDCNEDIPDDVVEGGECSNCGHVFYEEQKIRHELKYKGYTIIVEFDKDGKEVIIYPTHPIHDLDDDGSSSCPSIESCLQWIDVDIKCREEESSN